MSKIYTEYKQITKNCIELNSKFIKDKSFVVVEYRSNSNNDNIIVVIRKPHTNKEKNMMNDIINKEIRADLRDDPCWDGSKCSNGHPLFPEEAYQIGICPICEPTKFNEFIEKYNKKN